LADSKAGFKLTSALPDDPPYASRRWRYPVLWAVDDQTGVETFYVHYCLQALKSMGTQTNFLDDESVKTYLATIEVSEAGKGYS